MASRKFNIFQRTSGTSYSEKTLSKNRKYRMARDGTIIEYDDIVLDSQKNVAINSLDTQLANSEITQEQYDTQKITLERQYNSLEKLAAESATDELVFSGSKSDIRKGEMAERNISVLQNTKVDVKYLRYDIALFSPNEQPLAEKIMAFCSPVNLHVRADFAQADGTVVNYEGFVLSNYDISVKLNSNVLGYIRILAGGGWETNITSPFNIAKGDILSYNTPEEFEADLKNLSITLAANQIDK